MGSLTWSEAVTRTETVMVSSYDLEIDLTGGPEQFRSVTTVRFTASPGADTFLEVRPQRLREARLNGAVLPTGAWADGRLWLKGLAADNEVVVDADFPYSNASEGLHRFVDPADGEVYMYAQPAITQAPRFMACFDQPDLKAPVTLRVRADPKWTVRANSEGECTAPGQWRFPPTPPIATYLMTLAAGPFQARRAEHDGVPLGLYARASLGEALAREADELFEVTTAALDHYHQLFGIRYPFGKYDQVFAPEFSWGAMEFPGCVLIRDELMFQSAVTDAERERRAVLIAHEMAHMWFGNLVTMRWWDDLWLNESFADYLGWRVVAEATRWRGAWTSYSVARKTWAYVADQRPSTHPVAATGVIDTDAALANFDGISYAKGSAALRQLVAAVGDDAFRAGLRAYFDAHAYGNATLSDLLAALSAAAGRDLTQWARDWLETAQVNTLAPEVELAPQGWYSAVRVVQSAPPSHPVLRPHRVQVGWYADTGSAVVRQRQSSVDLDPTRDGGRTPVPDLVGAMPGLLIVNDDDLTYAKLRLAPGDLTRLPDLLPRVADPLARALLWNSAWDACRDAELAADRFVALAVAALPAETEVGIFDTVLDRARGVAVHRYLPASARDSALAGLAGVCRQVMGAGDARLLAAARGLIRCAGPEDVQWLEGWLTDGAPTSLTIDPDLRWLIILRLAVHGAADEDRIAAEAARDRGARGVQEATRCRAARPDPAAKEAAWRLMMTDRQHSNRVITAAADGFWQPEHAVLTAGYEQRYFDEIDFTAQWRSAQMLAGVALAAYPSLTVAPETLAAAQRWLAGPNRHPILHREVLDATDDLRRALAARQLAASADPAAGWSGGPA